MSTGSVGRPAYPPKLLSNLDIYHLWKFQVSISNRCREQSRSYFFLNSKIGLITRTEVKIEKMKKKPESASYPNTSTEKISRKSIKSSRRNSPNKKGGICVSNCVYHISRPEVNFIKRFHVTVDLISVYNIYKFQVNHLKTSEIWGINNQGNKKFFDDYR